MNIYELREKIDEIDNQLLSLLERRTKLATKVGKLRGSANQDKSREEEIIQRLVADNQEVVLSDQAITAIWQCIFEQSRQAQAYSLDTIKS